MPKKTKDIKHPVDSKRAERYVIRVGLEDDARFHTLLGLSASAFTFYRPLVSELIEFWNAHNTPPDLDSFKTWCSDVDAVYMLDEVMVGKPPQDGKHKVYESILRDGMIGRGMLELADFLADSVGTEAHGLMLRRAIAKLTDLTALSTDKATISRSFYWETAPERWERFKKYSADPSLLAGIDFGIKDIDRATRGLHALSGEADLVAIFGKPGTYKSRLMLNMAYSQVSRGIKVMFISREMSAERIGWLLDARESLASDNAGGVRLDYGGIEEAYFPSKRSRKRYQTMLKTLYTDRRLPLWMVDCPDVINTGDIIREIEIFYSAQGEYPKVIYLDYANLVDPVGSYEYESQKLDRLFIELLGITKGYSIPIVTPIRESRTGSLLKDRDDIGLEHVGLSQSIGYHVHQLWHLDHSKDDIQANRLWVRCKKNRYGPLFEAQLFVAPDYAYVGDRNFDIKDNYSDL